MVRFRSLFSRRLLLAGVAAVVLSSSFAGGAGAADRSGAPAAPAPVPCPHCWKPAVRTSWDWVIGKVPKAPYQPVAMYDIDGFEASAADVAAMHTAGIKVVCYLSAGTWEKFRPDQAEFPPAIIGNHDGWPGERWIDVREAEQPHSVLLSIMDTRLDMCAAKHFDAVELDNVDGYTNSTGFPLTAKDQLFYNTTLADAAHTRGLSVLQKNDNEQIPALLPYFDAALNEQCNQYKECTTAQTGKFGYDQYVAAKKAVFQAEYKLTTAQFCPADNAANFNGARFNLALNGKVFEPCRS
jgi:hypothetical protein